MRSTMSPAFTSSKIRHMVPFMVEVGNQMTTSLKKKMKEQGSKISKLPKLYLHIYFDFDTANSSMKLVLVNIQDNVLL